MHLTRKSGACFVSLVIALSGCATVHDVDGIPQRAPSGGQYTAFGDSITYGTRLKDRLREAYPYLVMNAENIAGVDYAIPGDQACDVAPRQIFTNGVNPAVAEKEISSVLIGTNDVDVRGAGAYEQVFIACHRAVIAWLGLPAEYKVVRGSGGFETSGAGSVGELGQAQVWTTGEEGAEVRLTIDLARPGSIYAWVVMDDSSKAAYRYELDGTVLGNAVVRTSPLLRTQNGTTRSVGLLRIASVPSGRHVVRFVQTSEGEQGVTIVGIGSPGVGAGEPLPVVLAGTVPFQVHRDDLKWGCHADDSPCLAYIRDIKEDLALFVSDGLDVRLFDTRKYMLGTSAEMVDGAHPNARGHRELAKSVEEIWPAQ